VRVEQMCREVVSIERQPDVVATIPSHIECATAGVPKSLGREAGT
jgi:hypothetical protein